MLGETAADLLPRWYRELWQPSVIFGPFFDEASAAMEAALPKMNEVIRRMHQAGVRIHLASDVMNPFIVPGASLHQELQLFVEAGLTPEEAWVTGTRWPGEFLGLPKLGTLQAGAPADFLLLGEDPTQDLAALSTLEAVAKAGSTQSLSLTRRMLSMRSASTAGCMTRLSPLLPKFCSDVVLRRHGQSAAISKIFPFV